MPFVLSNVTFGEVEVPALGGVELKYVTDWELSGNVGVEILASRGVELKDDFDIVAALDVHDEVLASRGVELKVVVDGHARTGNEWTKPSLDAGWN